MPETTPGFDPLGLPLRGSRLIEASAGTGKTWTLAALVLRLVVGHGCTARGVDEILVMTFTKAATRELTSRIRERLDQAAQAMRADDGDPSLARDPFMRGLRAALAAGPERDKAAWRLAMAAEAMDEASIFTIDAWCQRMLREHAFDSGSLFDETLLPDETALRAEAVRDVWRQQVYPLPSALLATVVQRWKDLDALDKDVRDLLDKPLPEGDGGDGGDGADGEVGEAGEGPLAACLNAVTAERARTVQALKAGWAERAAEMAAWVTEAWTHAGHPGRKAFSRKAYALSWFDAIAAWAVDPTSEQPSLSQTALERIPARAIRATCDALGHGGIEIPQPFVDFETLQAQLQQLPDPQAALRLHVAAAVRARLAELKARAGSFGFADALTRLDAALDEARHGERARRLRERILARYPVAMIDEFQDTSPLQLRIFDRLYRIADDDPSRTLLLIGDPKQAIYGFRGADIHSYLQARAATAGRHHTLAVNRRSTEALVKAVNRLFQGAEAHDAQGAFLFGAGDGPSPVPFVEVGAQGRSERLVGPDGPLKPITMAVDATRRPARGPSKAATPSDRAKAAAEGATQDAAVGTAEGASRRPTKADSQRRLAALCAEHIVQGLNDPAVGFENPDTAAFQRLRPGDIAVLVHSRHEADAVRRALQLRGVASVYLSDRDSVFASDEAADLLRLMQAVEQPRDLRLARAALATSLLGLPMQELIALAQDDLRLDRQCERLRQLGEAWRGRGILAMVRQALHSFGLPARWLAGDAVASRGERRLTNVLHLAELLQAAAPQARTPSALIDWLRRRIENADPAPEGGEQVLRLESDADRVQVVTIHKSKGLEYPLVFVPFAAQEKELARSGSKARNLALVLPVNQPGHTDHTGHTGRTLVLSPTEEQIEQARLELRREQLRLFYVAATRARHLLWLGLSDHDRSKNQPSTWPGSAPGHLLSRHGGMLQDVEAHAAQGDDVELQVVQGLGDTPWPPVTPLAPRQAPADLGAAPVYQAGFDRQWAVSSYSQLMRGVAAGASGHTGAERGHDAATRKGPELHDTALGTVPARRLRDDEPDDTVTPPEPAPAAWHRFPRGALAGDFLHDQLEWLAGERFGLDGSPELQQRLRDRCRRQAWDAHGDDVVTWLRRVCSHPLPALGAPLADLDTVAPEMEFWYPLEDLSLPALDACCRRHLLPGLPRPALSDRTLRGMMMGFADLVFEHGGRYWVLDHKSNALGHQDADYTAEALHGAMLAHRYDVQAALYLLALHRLLRARLGSAYDASRQLGGALYLFLRGVAGPSAGCCTLPATAALLDELDAVLPAAAPSPEQGSP